MTRLLNNSQGDVAKQHGKRRNNATGIGENLPGGGEGVEIGIRVVSTSFDIPDPLAREWIMIGSSRHR